MADRKKNGEGVQLFALLGGGATSKGWDRVGKGASGEDGFRIHFHPMILLQNPSAVL